MGDVRLFQIDEKGARELAGQVVVLEKSLQTLIEQHLQTLLGVRLVASEYSTGKTHSGRIDTLGIDENGCPVVIEYKRDQNQNVINQGLYYLNWLMDHQAEFEKLVAKARLAKAVADSIDWSNPGLLCIAKSFNRYDENAVQEIHRNVQLIRYKLYGNGLLLLDLLNSKSGPPVQVGVKSAKISGPLKTFDEGLFELPLELQKVYEELKAFALALGKDVQLKELKHYAAFQRLRNFVSVFPQQKKMLLHVRLDPATVQLEAGFSESHANKDGPGRHLRLRVTSLSDLEKAKPLIIKSYETG